MWRCEGFEKSEGCVSNWLDPFTGVAVIHVAIDVFSLMWPVERPADEFQCPGPPWVSCRLGIVVIPQYLYSQFVVVRNPDESVVCEQSVFFLAQPQGYLAVSCDAVFKLFPDSA